MDALSEILRVVRLDSAIYFNAELSEPWCLASPESSTLAPVLARGTVHVIIYHLLCEGRAYVQVQDGERVALSPGDIVTFPHGHGHVLGNGPSVAPVDVASALPGVLERGVDWLNFCRNAGLGCVLADDMGLGKTIQALAAIPAHAKS